MDKLAILKYSEIALKKKNRFMFENILIQNIEKRLENYEYEIEKSYGRLYLNYNDDRVVQIMRDTFGLIGVSVCTKVELDIDLLREKIVSSLKENTYLGKTFKVVTKRTNKNFHLDSLEINSFIGGEILEEIPSLSVDIKDPDFYVYIEVRKSFYFYFDTLKALGGLPYGSSGKTLMLMSGGIDSPVAAYLMAKRGVKVSAIHFHAEPFTSVEAKNKVKKLVEKLEYYTGDMKLYGANLAEAQSIIKKNTEDRFFTVLQRRLMLRTANKLARDINAKSITTGENLSQVASQTMEAIHCTNSVSRIPIFRPLIAYDKNDIIDISKKIDTFDTSILPFEDCCTLFLPKKVTTRPKLEDIIKQEENLDIENLVNKVYSTIEVE